MVFFVSVFHVHFILLLNSVGCHSEKCPRSHAYRHTHIHDYRYVSPNNNDFVQLTYNVTKCKHNRYVELGTACSFSYQNKGSVKIQFDDNGKYFEFLRSVVPGDILFSHYALRCSTTDRPFLLRVKKICVSQSSQLFVNIQGEEINPYEVFEHAKLSFSSNILTIDEKEPDLHLCKPQATWRTTENKSHASRPLISQAALPLAQENRTKFLATGFYSSDGTKLIRPMRPWHIRFPNRPLSRQNLFRWMCSSCNITILPTVRFEMSIEHYRLKSLLIIVEGAMLLSLSPELRLDFFYTRLKRTIGSYSWKPIYLSVGGIPFEIQPKVRMDLRILALVNTVSPLSFSAMFGGSFEGGIQYTESTGLVTRGFSNLLAVPRNYVLLLGKTFSEFTGPNFVGIDLRDCAMHCCREKHCLGFQYQQTSRNCTLTSSVSPLKASRGPCSDWVFQRNEWMVPTFNPTLTGAVRPMLQTILTLDINRVGGPVISFASAPVIVFFRAHSSSVTLMEVHGIVYFYVGGLVYIRVGNRKIFNREVLPELYRTTVYKISVFQKRLSIQGGSASKTIDHIKYSQTPSFYETTDEIARRVEKAFVVQEGSIDVLSPRVLEDIEKLANHTFYGFCSARNVHIEAKMQFHLQDLTQVSFTYVLKHNGNREIVDAQFQVVRNYAGQITLKRVSQESNVESLIMPIPKRLILLRGQSPETFAALQPSSVCAVMYFRKGSSAKYIKRGERLFKGTSIFSSHSAITITRTGMLKISQFRKKRTYSFSFVKPIDRLEFFMSGKVSLIDAHGKVFHDFNPLSLRKGDYLSCGEGLSLAAYWDETCAFDQAWQIPLQSCQESEDDDFGQPPSKERLLRNQCLFPGEGIVSDDTLLFFDGGITVMAYEYDLYHVIWKSPFFDARMLAFNDEGNLCLMGYDGTMLWTLGGGPSALAIRPFFGGIAFFSDTNCTKQISCDSSSRESSFRSFPGFFRCIVSPFRRAGLETSPIKCTFEDLFLSKEESCQTISKKRSYCRLDMSHEKLVQRVQNDRGGASLHRSLCETAIFRVQKELLNVYSSRSPQGKMITKQDIRSCCLAAAGEALPNCTNDHYELICNACLSRGNQRRIHRNAALLDLLLFVTSAIFLLEG